MLNYVRRLSKCLDTFLKMLVKGHPADLPGSRRDDIATAGTVT